VDAHAQLRINEVCSKNYRSAEDAFGHHTDWIELHNAGTSAVQLGQYYLSDRLYEPGMWRMPEILLEAGGHVLFFSAHSESGDDHFPFGVAQEGESVFLFSEAQQLLDRMDIPALISDHSAGIPLGGQEVRVFQQPTPGAPNSTPDYAGYATMPLPGIAPGPVPAGSSLLLHTSSGGEIRISLDGKDPDADSPLCTGAVVLDSTVVVKAQASLPDHLPSPVFTGTYFVNLPQGLPVVSLSVEPDSMFHEELGLYMMGPDADAFPPYHGANFWSNRHIPVRMEFFDEQGRQRHVQQVDLRMHGGTQARTKPQRSLRLTGRKRYGNSLIEYPFFPERGGFDQYKHVVLRNSGGDFCLAHFRDGFWHQRSLHAGLDIDELAFRPVRVFINGAYWGLMNLRERISPQDVALNHGLDSDEVLFFDQENEPLQGDSIHFALLNNYILEEDLNDPLHFHHVDSLMDLKSLKDYLALEIFAGNADWPSNNVRAWKPSVDSGKWRYVLHDLDATMNVFGWITMDVDMFQRLFLLQDGELHSRIFLKLLENDEFKRTFINRLADLMNTSLSPPGLMAELDRITSATDAEAQRHYARWSCDWNTRLWHAGEVIPEFITVRGGHVQDHVLHWFSLPNKVALTFESFPPAAGSIALNTLDPPLPFKGTYFNGNAIDLAAHANEGFVFDHWGYTGSEGTLSTSATYQGEFATDGTITAHFRKQGQQLYAFPVPCADLLHVSYESAGPGSGQLRLADMDGRVVLAAPQAVQAGVNKFQLDLTHLTPGVYVLTMEQPEGISSARVIKTRE
jgi:hypothetical protein